MGKTRMKRCDAEDDDESLISAHQKMKHISLHAASTSSFNVSREDKRTSSSVQKRFSRGKKRARRSGFTLHQTSTPSAEVSPKRLCIRNGQSVVHNDPSVPVVSFPDSDDGSDNKDASVSYAIHGLKNNESDLEGSDSVEEEHFNEVDEDVLSEKSDSSNVGEESSVEEVYESCSETSSVEGISPKTNICRNRSPAGSGKGDLHKKMKFLSKDSAQENQKISDDDDDEEDIVSRSSNSMDRSAISHQQQMDAGRDGIPSGVRLFLHRGSALVTLSDFAAISFGGSAWFQVIRGSVRVYGIRLRSTDGPVHLQSVPGSCILLSNTGSTEENGTGQNLRDRMQSIGAGLALDKARDLISRFPRKTIVVFHGSTTGDGHYTSLKPNFRMASDSTPEDMWINNRFYLIPSERCLTANSSLKRFEDLCASLVKAAGRTIVRVAVVGSRNSGKSTTLRVLCNRILHSCVLDEDNQRVNDTPPKSVPLFILDLDPGQTEFTPSACISLVEVNCFLMGPPGAHQIKPRKSFLLGDSTAGARPETYVAAVTSLVGYIKNELSFNHILIINTMGWLSGIGDVLLGTILDLTKPCKVLATSDGFQVPALAWPAKEIQLDVPVTRVSVLEGLYSRDIYTKPVTAADQRRSTLINYFGGLSILNKKTIVISWNSVALHEVSGLCPPQELLRLMNASAVALTRAPTEMIWKSKSDPTLPMLLRESPGTSHEPLECLGFAFVRAIDVVRKTLQLITIETEETVRSANALVHCTGVNITDFLVVNQNRDGRQGIAPYSTGRHVPSSLYIREQ